MSKKNCVDMQIRNVPLGLLSQFDEVVVRKLYPGGRSEAVRDLMRKAIQEQQAKESQRR